jgi:hypothetical protein
MTHPLVEQLRFTRGEWLRALEGMPAPDAERRLPPMNSVGWIVGHLAWHEQLYWLTRAQGLVPLPALNEVVASGGPATTPPLAEMLEAWRDITAATDPWLDGLGQADIEARLPGPPGSSARLVGSMLYRVTYHYWFHIGEILAIRQVLGHADLPDFVGDIDALAPYRPEAPGSPA